MRRDFIMAEKEAKETRSKRKSVAQPTLLAHKIMLSRSDRESEIVMAKE
jgi:hypothetical protein